jgi:hypothetical protein
LIEYAVEGKARQTQLFDHVQDPWERTNLADDPDFADKRAVMTEELIRLRDEWDDRKHPMGETFWNRYETNA